MPRLATSAEPVSLFDGKTFAGWEGNNDVFRIEDGAIVGGSLEHKFRAMNFSAPPASMGISS